MNPSKHHNNPSILMDKFNGRRSTPDSEALASSDDEVEHRDYSQQPPSQPQKPTRRASWLNDTTQVTTGQPRKGSFASSSMSPTTSHPTTPSAESGNWGTHSQTSNSNVGRGHTGSGSFPWPSGIWTSESRKEPPSRLTEVLPSPTSVQSPSSSVPFLGETISTHKASTSFFAEPASSQKQSSSSPFFMEGKLSQKPSSSSGGFFADTPNSQKAVPYLSEANNNHKDTTANPTIPFAIPLHPTPKTYRSQSYSVGQLDSDSASSSTTTTPSGGPVFAGRGRQLHNTGLQHRPSRPSMLSEMSNEGGLANLKEVDDDDDVSTTESNRGVALNSSESKAYEALARENAMMRQQQAQQQAQQQSYQASRLRPRSSASNAYNMGGGYSISQALPEESDYAIDELDEINELQEIASKGLLGRRLSEYGTGAQPRLSPYVSLENRKIENVKKAYWQSSLGFGGLADIPQSRRHSFADVPTRQGSVSSVGEPLSAHEAVIQENMSPAQARYQEASGYGLNDHGEHNFNTNRRLSNFSQKQLDVLFEQGCVEALRDNYSHQNPAASYFGGPPTAARNADSYGTPAYQQTAYPFTAPQQYIPRAPSPHRSMYGVPQPRHNQLLYIVLFKCSRADVFYVQEGTGLSVKPGDLVIVEADRGTDLGTVAKDNVDWTTAKDLKEHYAEEHYKWLMMYSQGAAGNTDGTGAGLMAASNGLQGSAVGGMGPPNQHGMQEPNPGEIKPKIIKRLAQQHEIQSLRDKEGNEAKAKRVCMQKVKEHGLHMEILDAEFQMDWKKLTFYYFADAYINFNSLVTDLFKVYKTRIWMSAINPASFASPSIGLQAPSGIGPGAVGVSRNTQAERRPQPADQQPSYGLPQAGRGFQGVYSQPFGSNLDRPSMPPTVFQPSGYTYGYSPFTAAPRNLGVSASGYVPMDPFAAFQAPTDYQGLPGRFPSPHTTAPGHEGADFGRPSGIAAPDAGWINSFQGLSMNTR